MTMLILQRTCFTVLLTANLACSTISSFAADPVTTDIGTLDQETAEKAFPAKQIGRAHV